MTDLLILAERVESATGPDRELDGQIAEIAEPWRVAQTRCIREADGAWGHIDDKLLFQAIPAYTASLDAAMTLVPEGWGYSICPLSTLLTRRAHGRDESIMGRGATPALALTVAALKATAATLTENATVQTSLQERAK